MTPPSESAMKGALILEGASSFANSVNVVYVARTLTPTLAPAGENANDNEEDPDSKRKT